MKPHKTIQLYDVAELEDETGILISSIIIGDYGLIGITKFNENLLSTISDRIINIAVKEDKIDNFLCFFLKNRIVLTEKIRRKIRFRDLIKKKYWSNTCLIEFDQSDFFLFESVDANLITMNNNTEILVPIFGKS